VQAQQREDTEGDQKEEAVRLHVAVYGFFEMYRARTAQVQLHPAMSA
jgi:hypothetical protein